MGDILFYTFTPYFYIFLISHNKRTYLRCNWCKYFYYDGTIPTPPTPLPELPRELLLLSLLTTSLSERDLMSHGTHC